jgi:uncharacterized protein
MMCSSADRHPKRERLEGIVRDLGDAAVAFSGGVDSTLVLAIALAVLPPEHVVAVTARSQLTPAGEIARARELAHNLGAHHHLVDVDALGDRRVSANPPGRCYFCKRLIFGRLLEVARGHGLRNLLHGANVDDQGDFRPGMRAALELGARAPLLDAGFTKQDVRELSAQMGLPTADLPSSACLASRVPYGQPLSTQTLARIEAAESAVRELTTVVEFRVRDHHPVARLEIPTTDFHQVIERGARAALVARLRALGYRYVTLDLTGFRSGSLNEMLSEELE